MGEHVYKTPLLSPGTSLDLEDKWLGEEVPDLELIPRPARFHMTVKQLHVRKKIGSILMPDQVVDAQGWTHGMGIVLKLGKAVYRGRKYEDMGLTPEDDGPQVGDVILFQARTAPVRYKVQGIEVLVIPDDAYHSTCDDRRQVEHLSFNL